MIVIYPIVITEARLISSNVAESEYAAYSAAANYVVGARVIYQHKIFECAQTPNTGHAPDANPLFWGEVGPSNRWAMLDGEISTQTANASEINFTIKSGRVNGLALFGLEASDVFIIVRNGLLGTIVYSKSVSLDMAMIPDGDEYVSEAPFMLGEMVLTDLPLYTNAYITVSITGPGTVKCGTVAVGSKYYLGETQVGAGAGITDYSKKTAISTGGTRFVKGKFSKKMSIPLIVQNDQLDRTSRILSNLRSTPAAWIASDENGYGILTTFGFCSDFSFRIESVESPLSIEVEGLT